MKKGKEKQCEEDYSEFIGFHTIIISVNTILILLF